MKKRKSAPVQTLMFGSVIETAPAPRPVVSEETFLFMGKPVRAVRKDGNHWVVARDVCDIIGIGDVSMATRNVPIGQKGTNLVGTPGGKQNLICISVEAANFIAARSDKPEGIKLAWWLVSEVLPALQTAGTYTVPSSRQVAIAKKAKKLGCDHATAETRLEVTDANKVQADRLRNAGAKPVDYANIHNAAYIGAFGKTAVQLRKDLGQPKGATPLDRMGQVPLCIQSLAKACTEQKARDSGGLSIDQHSRVLEKHAREISGTTLATMGEDYAFAVVDDARRGKIFDAVRMLSSDRREDL